MISLGIDGGGSSTRWLLLSEEGEIARGKTDSFSGLFFSEAEKQKNLKTLDSLIMTIKEYAKPDIVVAGITGLGSSPIEQKIHKMLASKLRIKPERVIIKNDMYIAYRAAFELAEGVLVYAGTGSIAYYISKEKTLRAGGRGYMIDDAGGGFWIGQQALRNVLRQEDELGKAAESILAQEVYTLLEVKDWESIKAKVYSGGRKMLASLSPAVVAAAKQDDPVAKSILQDAGKELARLANALLKQLAEKKPVAFAGGISKIHPLLNESLKASLKNNTDLRIAQTEAVEAAARIGLELIASNPKNS